MSPAAGLTVDQVMAVVRRMRVVGCRFWVEGGWGVDALAGRQTRPHRDLDIDIDGAFEAEVLAALHDLGYQVETDWRPNRVELVAPGRGWVDVHPLLIDEAGNARQGVDNGLPLTRWACVRCRSAQRIGRPAKRIDSSRCRAPCLKGDRYGAAQP